MKKNLLLRLCLMMSVVLSLCSCVSDDLTPQENSAEKTSSFQIFRNKGSKDARKGSSTLYYQEAFRDLYFSYYKDHPEEAPDFKDFKKPYVDFRFASQVLYAEDSTRYVLFPFVENGKIKYVMACSVNSKHDYVAFYFPEKSEIVQDAIIGFSLAVEGRGTPGFDMDNPAPIEGVVIPTPPRAVYTLMSFNPVFNYPMPPSGGCGTYHNCGGGGGTTSPVIPPQQTPCQKIKETLAKPQVQAKINELKAQSTAGGEKGVKFKADGTPSATIPGGAHSVNFGDKTGYAGAYHNHTPTGIPILSPPDIDQLLGFARAQPTSNPANVNNAFMGMVAPNGMHYVIWFNGTYQDTITNFSQDQLDGFDEDYSELASDLTTPLLYGQTYRNSDGSINSLGVEKLFFTTLKKMGLEGKVNLQRIESDGIVKVIGLDGSNQPVSTTCS